MKACPVCKTLYSDDTLRFCLQDGAALEAGGETETVVLRAPNTKVGDQPEDRTVSAAGSTDKVTSAPRSKTLMWVVLTAVVMTVLFGFLGLAGWLYMRNNQPTNANTEDNRPATSSSNRRAANVPSQTPESQPVAMETPGRSVTNGNAVVPVVDRAQIRQDVTLRLNSWKLQAEALNLDAHMAHYAATVDYYNKEGASSVFVRADREKAFSRYASISIILSNIAVSPSRNGQTADVTFDKEWDFSGNGSFTGKVRQMIRFAKLDGEWLITAEKDLKVYR